MEEAARESLPQQDAEPGKAPPERKFHCTFDPNCKSRFSRSEHLQRHIRKHTGERPFKCDCGRTFSRMDNLRQHAQTVHAGDETNLAAWPATKILPVTPVAPLPAEARAQIKVSSDTPNDTPAASKSVSTKPATTSSNRKTDTKAESTQRAPGSAGRRSTGSAQRTSDDPRPYPKASERPKRSPRQAATTAAAPAKSGRVATPTRTRERNYESFSSNLSLYRPSILHHLDETASGGVYGKRRSMAQNQNNNTQASSLLLAPLGELRNVPPYHSVRADELPPVVSFDRYTARTLSEAPSSRTTQSSTPAKGGLLCRSAQPASSTTSSTENSACGSQSTVVQNKRSQSVRGSLHQDRQMSIASLCTTDHRGSSSSNDGHGYSQGEQRSSIDSDKHYAPRSVSEGNRCTHYATAPATAV